MLILHSYSVSGRSSGGRGSNWCRIGTYECSSQKIAACLSLHKIAVYIYIYIYIYVCVCVCVYVCTLARLYWVLILKADPSGRADYGLGLLSFGCWDCGFQFRWRLECVCLMSGVCCQVEVSAKVRSLVRRRPRPTRAVESRGGTNFKLVSRLLWISLYFSSLSCNAFLSYCRDNTKQRWTPVEEKGRR